MNLKDILLKYIINSPYCDGKRDWPAMSVDEMLEAVGGSVDKNGLTTGHSYKVVKIDTYQDALRYKEYAPDWCIIGSEAAFYEHLCGGRNQFYFCVRDDMQSYRQKSFGKEYPYDNYGLSLIAVCVNGWGELVSVTSRWNYEENCDHYLTKEQLTEILGTDFESTFCPSRIETILHLSDTHGTHKQLGNLPKADLIIHSGDVGMAGTEAEVMDFLNWFLDLPYRYKIYVPGNHDNCLLDSNIEGLDPNCFCLSNSGVVIEGLKFYGLPMFMEHSMRNKSDWYIRQIPFDTDVLITHQPPFGILDFARKRHFGSSTLLKRVEDLQPRYHLFGHIHDAYGEYSNGKTTFYNGALMDEKCNLVHQPRVIKI